MRKPAKSARGPRNQRRGPYETAKKPGKCGVILWELRKRLNLTQANTAKKVRTPQSVVSKLETNDDMHLSTLSYFARALGVEVVITLKFPGKQTPNWSYALPKLARVERDPKKKKKKKEEKKTRRAK